LIAGDAAIMACAWFGDANVTAPPYGPHDELVTAYLLASSPVEWAALEPAELRIPFRDPIAVSEHTSIREAHPRPFRPGPSRAGLDVAHAELIS